MTGRGSDLEHATRVEGDGGRYVARLSKDWEIWGPNGGYLAAFALRAAGMVAQIQQPASFYCHFLNSPAFDAIELKVSVLKQGRRAESLAVEMTQKRKPILQAMVKTAADGIRIPPPASEGTRGSTRRGLEDLPGATASPATSPLQLLE